MSRRAENPEFEQHHLPGIEYVHPGHFYAAYVFDHAQTRQDDIRKVLVISTELGYPVRFWWLSQALNLEGSPDRLILCVHHPSSAEDAGMDLYERLTAEKASWDDLDSASLGEYVAFGKRISAIEKICDPHGVHLFPKLPLDG